MAYRRFRPNRRFRNSGASRLRRSSYRRRNFRASRRSFAYRRRYRGRGRRNMGAARVRRLAARKKSDHSVGAVSDLMPLNSNVVLSGPENVFVLYCPSYLPRQQAPKEIARRDHLREQSNVFYRGVKEEVFLSASRPLFWRRVVFYMALEAEVARPIYAAHPSTGTCFGCGTCCRSDLRLGRPMSS